MAGWEEALPVSAKRMVAMVKGSLQDDEAMIRQAFYNSAANGLVVLMGITLVALYFVFEMFLRPLLWAVLIGSIMHPIKSHVVRMADSWLQAQVAKGRTLIGGLVHLGFRLPTEVLGFVLFDRKRALVVLITGLSVSEFLQLDDIINAGTSAYHWLVIFGTRTLETSERVATYMQLPITTYLYSVPVSSLLACFCMLVIWIFWFLEWTLLMRNAVGVVYLILLAYIYPLAVDVLGVYALLAGCGAIAAICLLGGVSRSAVVRINPNVSVRARSPDGRTAVKASSLAGSRSRSVSVPPKPLLSAKSTPALRRSGKGKEGKKEKWHRSVKAAISSTAQRKSPALSRSTEICLILIFVCVMVSLWRLVPLLLFWAFLVTICRLLYYRLLESPLFSEERVAAMKWYLVPPPVMYVYDLFWRGDRAISEWLRSVLDTIVVILMILGLIAGALLVVVFFAVQFQAESQQVANHVWNQRSKVAEAWSNVAGEEFERTYEVAVNATVSWVQNWTQEQISAFTGQDVEIEELQTQVVKAWNSNSNFTLMGNRTDALTTLDWDRFLSSGPFLLVNEVFAGVYPFIKENINMFTYTLKAVWAQAVANLKLLWWFFTQVYSVFNYFLSFILFLTSLFYLLASSGSHDGYKPYSWLLFMIKGDTRVVVQDYIRQAIEEVFETSVKIALFHGLWTWVTYKLFDCSLVYITSVLSACLAVTALVGSYWTCVPAVLELWLFLDKPVHALVLFFLHLYASWFIDPVIYGEIKDSHYYVTGLSVVGGLYFLGLEGVLFGPMLLCTILIFSKIIQKVYYGYRRE